MEILDDMLHVVACRQPLQQNAELVAANPRDHILFEQRATQAQANLLQQAVAAVMAEGVVDILEMVEIQQQQGDGANQSA